MGLVLRLLKEYLHLLIKLENNLILSRILLPPFSHYSKTIINTNLYNFHIQIDSIVQSIMNAMLFVFNKSFIENLPAYNYSIPVRFRYNNRVCSYKNSLLFI